MTDKLDQFAGRIATLIREDMEKAINEAIGRTGTERTRKQRLGLASVIISKLVDQHLEHLDVIFYGGEEVTIFESLLLNSIDSRKQEDEN